MSWQTIGTIDDTAQGWVRFPQLFTGSKVLRVTQQWFGESPGSFWVTVRSFYPGTGVTGYQRIYPSNTETILYMSIPSVLLEAGLVSWYLEGKINERARFFAEANWSLAIAAWSDSSLAIQRIDAGVY